MKQREKNAANFLPHVYLYVFVCHSLKQTLEKKNSERFQRGKLEKLTIFRTEAQLDKEHLRVYVKMCQVFCECSISK